MTLVDESEPRSQATDLVEPWPRPPQPPAAIRPPQRRQVRGMSRAQLVDLLGAAATGVCVALLLFGRLATFAGPIGFVVIAWIVFVATYAVLVSLGDDRIAVRDAVMTVVLYSAGIVVFSALASVVIFTLWRGRDALVHANFYTQDMSKAGPLDPLSRGGIAHALVGTIWMISIALVFSAPLGVACAVYLNESRSRSARFVRTVVEAMTALPTILAGLYIYAVWILMLGFEKSGLAAAMALSVMMMPFIIRTSDLVLRLVPANLREASAALGASRWRTVRYVVLPTARSGLATGVILGVARGIGETSPVLLTAGFTTYMNTDPIHGPMVSLPLEALKLVASGEPRFVARGFACAAFLLLVVLGLFVIARLLGGRGPGHLSARQQRRLARRSERDLARLQARHSPNRSAHEELR